MSIKGNRLIFSSIKKDRIKGYKKLLKYQEDQYTPSKDIAKNITEAMDALGYDVTVEEAMAYLKSSQAVYMRDFHERHLKR